MGRKVECVNKQKYLPVALTPMLSLESHLKEQLKKAKLGLNIGWNSVVVNKDIALPAKTRLFNMF